MPDPAEPDFLAELSNFDPGPTMNPLPATEVRRRGTRLRRRNTALSAVGAAAAIAVVAVPVGLLNGHDGPSTPPVAGPTWVQQIPEDFPLTSGMVESATTSSTYEAQVDEVCADAAWSADGALDTRQAVVPQSEGAQDRTLALYPSQAQARAALGALDTRVEACAEQTRGDFPRAEVLPSAIGDGSVVYANRYTDGGDLSLVQVVQVGNALLQATEYTTGLAPEAAAADVQDRTSATVAALCVFSADGCSDTAINDGGAAQVVPDDFPLTDGYPAQGTIGPDRALSPIVPEECDASVDVPEHTDLVRAGYHADGDDRERQLVTFADEQQAQAYLTSVVELYQNCVESTEDGKKQLVQALSDISGYDAAGGAHIRWERDGKPLPGVETVAVVRVGSSVVLSTISTDESVGADGGRIQEQTQRAFTSIQGVVDAMSDLP